MDTSEQGFCEEHQIAEADCPYCRPGIIDERGPCPEHGVPEALCHKCHPALVAAFKSVGDWCAGHGVPESQCLKCNPELAKDDVEVTTDIRIPRIKRAPDPSCPNIDVVVKLNSPKTATRAGIKFEKVRKRSVRDTVSCNAAIAYAGNRYARVASRVPAVVLSVQKDLGDKVSVGETLAVLDSVDLGVAKTDFLKLLETVATGREKVKRAQAYFDRLNRLEVRLAAIDLIKARELFLVSKKNEARESRLMERQSGSEKSLLDARAELSAAQANVMALEKKLTLFGITVEVLDSLSWQGVDNLQGRGSVSEQEVLNARIDLRVAQANLQASRRRLLTLGLSMGQIDAVADANDTSTQLPLLAPFDGQVVELAAVIGEVVDSRKMLFALADSSKLWAMLDIHTKLLGRIHNGQRVVFSVDGLPGENFVGQLNWVSSHVDPKTRTIKARAELANPTGLLRANMFGKATIVIHDSKETVVVVSKESVQWEGCCNVVFIRHTDTLYETRKVRLGLEKRDIYVVEDGLEGGESVVTTGSFLLKTEILKGNIGAGCCAEDN